MSGWNLSFIHDAQWPLRRCSKWRAERYTCTHSADFTKWWGTKTQESDLELSQSGFLCLLCFFFVCVSCVVVFRPGQTEAGLLLHRHLLPQQHLRVRLLLLPTRVTVCSLPSPPRARSGKQSCLSSSLYKKKKKPKKKNLKTTEQKPALTVFLCAIQPPVNQWSGQLSQSVLHLFRERRDGDRLSRLSPEPRRHSLHV